MVNLNISAVKSSLPFLLQNIVSKQTVCRLSRHRQLSSSVQLRTPGDTPLVKTTTTGMESAVVQAQEDAAVARLVSVGISRSGQHQLDLPLSVH